VGFWERPKNQFEDFWTAKKGRGGIFSGILETRREVTRVARGSSGMKTLVAVDQSPPPPRAQIKNVCIRELTACKIHPAQ